MMRKPSKRGFPKRLEDQRKAKKKNLAQFKKKKPGKKKSTQKQKVESSDRHADKSKSGTQSKVEPVSAFNCTAKFADERDEPLEYSVPQTLYTSIAGDLRNCSVHEKLSVRLLWPAFPSSVPAIHTIATCGAYESGDQLGLRALFWPAKATSFRELNHIRIDACWLYQIAQQWQSLKVHDPNKYAESIKSKCTHKDILFLSLRHYLDEGGDPMGYPSIGETFATFPVGRTIWGDFGKKIFNGVFSHVSRKGIPLADLGDPSTAPDAIFGIHPDASVNEILDRLATDALSPSTGRPPDVVLVNLDTQSRFWLGGNWSKKAVRFLEILSNDLPTSPIGVLVLMDDPLAYLALLRKLAASRVHSGRQMQAQLPLDAKAKLSLSHTITSHSETTTRSISDTKTVAHIVDAEAAAVAASLNQAAQEVQADSEALSGALRSCAGFILWSARLPSGPRALQQMLHDDSRSDQELQWRTRNYSWSGIVAKLEETRSSIGDAGEVSNIDLLLEKATRLLSSYATGTPSGTKLEELIRKIMEQTQGGRSRRKKRSKPTVTIAVPGALQARLVMSFVEAKWPLYDDFGNEVIQVLRTVELFTRGAPIIARRLIVIGANAQVIAELCSAKNLPKRIELILSAGDADRIVRTLSYILDDEEFESLHEPLSNLVGDLSAFLEAESIPFSILDRLVYWRPQDHADAVSSSTQPPDSRIDIRFDLDDGRTIGMSKSRLTLVYNESRRPPYIQKTASKLRVGDHILDISDEMRNDIEVFMDLAGRFKSESVVRAYHQHVFDRLNEDFPSLGPSQRISEIRQRFAEAFPNSEGITDTKIRYWVTVNREIDLPFEELVSHAPQAKEDYDMFMQILNIDDQIAELYWGLGITSLRSDRRYEGRQAALVYQRLLLDPASVASLLSIPPRELSRLQTQARRNVFEVLHKTDLQ